MEEKKYKYTCRDCGNVIKIKAVNNPITAPKPLVCKRCGAQVNYSQTSPYTSLKEMREDFKMLDKVYDILAYLEGRMASMAIISDCAVDNSGFEKLGQCVKQVSQLLFVLRVTVHLVRLHYHDMGNADIAKIVQLFENNYDDYYRDSFYRNYAAPTGFKLNS